MATAADRSTLATRSHAFNISQPKFKRIFPEYSKDKQQNLPNMGESKREAEGDKSKQPLASSSALGSKTDEVEGTGGRSVGGGVAGAGKV